MSSEQLRLDAAVLEAALREGLPVEHPSLRALFARRPAWAELLAQASGAADLRPELLARLRAAEQPEDRRLIDELLAQARQGVGPTSAARARRVPTWLLAAAGLLLAVALTWSLSSRESSRSADVVLLGDDDHGTAEDERIVLVAPRERVERFENFQWSSTRALAPDESYVLILWEAQADGTPGAELRRMTTRESSWQPDAFDLSGLPARLHWSVQRVSPRGSGPRSEAWVERSSP